MRELFPAGKPCAFLSQRFVDRISDNLARMLSPDGRLSAVLLRPPVPVSGIDEGTRHAWLAYMVDKPPRVEPVLKHEIKPWEKSEHIPNLTFSHGAYKPYSTCVAKRHQVPLGLRKIDTN